MKKLFKVSEPKRAMMYNVLYVPQLACNLFSVQFKSQSMMICWLNQKELATGVKFPKAAELSFCKGCVEGKMHRKPFKPLGEICSTQKLQLIHSDVCGPMSMESIGGQKYFVTFIDDYILKVLCCVLPEAQVSSAREVQRI